MIHNTTLNGGSFQRKKAISRRSWLLTSSKRPQIECNQIISRAFQVDVFIYV
jgi:hypothetical protein